MTCYSQQQHQVFTCCEIVGHIYCVYSRLHMHVYMNIHVVSQLHVYTKIVLYYLCLSNPPKGLPLPSDPLIPQRLCPLLPPASPAPRSQSRRRPSQSRGAAGGSGSNLLSQIPPPPPLQTTMPSSPHLPSPRCPPSGGKSALLW